MSYYNYAALKGGKGLLAGKKKTIGDALKEVCGGWNFDLTQMGDAGTVERARFGKAIVDESPGFQRWVIHICRKYQLNPDKVYRMIASIAAYDQVLKTGAPEVQLAYARGLKNQTDAYQRVFKYMRNKIHAGGTRPHLTRAQRLTRLQNNAATRTRIRDIMNNTPYWGTSPYDEATGRKTGLFRGMYVGIRATPRTGAWRRAMGMPEIVHLGEGDDITFPIPEIRRRRRRAVAAVVPVPMAAEPAVVPVAAEPAVVPAVVPVPAPAVVPVAAAPPVVPAHVLPVAATLRRRNRLARAKSRYERPLHIARLDLDDAGGPAVPPAV